MTTELVTSSAPVVAVKGDELEVSAATPNEMAQSQDALIAWAKRKVALTEAEASELHEAHEIAKKRNWVRTTLLKHATLASKRVVFYQKLLSALEHGYIIVPTFPVDVFAVRTNKSSPRGVYVSSYSYGENPKLSSIEHKPKGLAEGEGEYQNPFPAVGHDEGKTDSGGAKHTYFAYDWREMEFPFNMAKPNIMNATDRAMMLKIFDDFGVLPNANKRVDPIIVGRIKAPKKSTYQDERIISFIIAWHLDTRTL